MLFTYDDIGGLDGINRWLDLASKYRVAIDPLVGHRYMPKMDLESRFFNMYTAAESLIRIQLSQQNIRPFSKRLARLVNELGTAFAPVVGDVNTWASIVVKTRVNSVVHRGLHDGADQFSLRILSETLYFLVIFYLLFESGMSRDQLTAIREQRLGYLEEDVRGTSWYKSA